MTRFFRSYLAALLLMAVMGAVLFAADYALDVLRSL